MFTKLRKVTVSFDLPVHPPIHPSTRNNSAANGQIFLKLYIGGFY